MSAEFAARRRLITLLQEDHALALLAHAVFDGEPLHASPPYIMIGTALGSPWGTKDRPGRQVRVTIVIAGHGDQGPEEASCLVTQALLQMRGEWEDWDFVAVRRQRTRLTRPQAREWRYQLEIECRMLSAINKIPPKTIRRT